MENKNVEIKHFGTWDWIVLVCSVLLVLLGLYMLLFGSKDGIGFLFWGLIMGYIKFKKLKATTIK